LEGDQAVSQPESILKGKRILLVDDEADVLEAVKELLDGALVDGAITFETADRKIAENTYDMAVLDIMGVNGLELLEKSVRKGIPTVMFTAFAMNVDSFMQSVRKGAIGFLPKEHMVDMNRILANLLEAHEKGKEPWKILFDELAGYFDLKFGPEWKEKNKAFWNEFKHVIKTQHQSDI
jgi:DNA-binding NtrC family response regulator